MSGDLVLLWHAEDADADWEVEYRPGPDQTWRQADAPTMRRVAVPTIATHRVYRADLKDLAAGATFAYRVRRGGEVVFSAEGPRPKGPASPIASWSSATAGRVLPSRRRSPTRRTWPGPTS